MRYPCLTVKLLLATSLKPNTWNIWLEGPKKCWRSCCAHDELVIARSGDHVWAFPVVLMLRGQEKCFGRKKWDLLCFPNFYWIGLAGKRVYSGYGKDLIDSAAILFYETRHVQSTRQLEQSWWSDIFSIDCAWRMHCLTINISWINRFFIDGIRRYN